MAGLPKAERSPITLANRGVRLSERLQRRRSTSASRFPFRFPEGFRSGEPRRFGDPQPLKTEHGIHALQGVASCCLKTRPWTGCLHTACAAFRQTARAMPRDRSNGRLPPSGFVGDQTLYRRFPVSVFSRRFGGRYRTRTCIASSQTGALPIRRTVADVIRSEPIHGTRSTEPCRVTCAPLDERHHGPCLKEVPVGIEPTSAELQTAASPFGSSTCVPAPQNGRCFIPYL